jgi:nucleoid-associated protein YgaU
MEMYSNQRRRADFNMDSPTSALVRVAMLVFVALGTAPLSVTAANTVSLRGSAASMDEQNDQAKRHDFTFVREASQLRRFAEAGLLVPVAGNVNYRLKDVSFPYARPAVRLFIERLSKQYRQACGEQLVITSLTRPLANQPRNASPRSVHPTGMALDVRRPSAPTCRGWLESTLLYLEEQSVIEATRERAPPHYHVAVFTRDYASYVGLLKTKSPSQSTTTNSRHIVRRRDTVWHIARLYGTTPADIFAINGLKSSVIRPGQVLKIPPTPRSAQ